MLNSDMEAPLFGKISVDPKVKQAVGRAFKKPCALCGSSQEIRVRQIIPRKPKLFALPAGIAFYLPLCRDCAHADPIDIEAHLLACRLLQTCERFGLRVDIED
jgi:predicted restriction endonuclease